MPYDTPYNRMIARNQQQTDEEYADYHAYSNQNYLREGSMGDARGNLRLFPKMVQREYYTPIDYSGGITHRNMEGNGGPLGRQFNSIALGEDTRRQHNKSAMYAPVRPIGSGSSGGMRYAREDDRHYSSSESDSSDDEEMSGCGVPGHRKLLKHLSKLKLPKDVHNEVCEWLEEMEKSGRGLEGRGGVWDWIKGAASKVGSVIKPIAQVAMPLIKTFTPYGKIIGAVSEGAKALIPGAEEKLAEYGLGYRGNGVVVVPSPERGNSLTDVRSIGNGLWDSLTKATKAQQDRQNNERRMNERKMKEMEKKMKDMENKASAPAGSGMFDDPFDRARRDFKKKKEKMEADKKKPLPTMASFGFTDTPTGSGQGYEKLQQWAKKMDENRNKRNLEYKKGQDALAREKAVPAPTGSGASGGAHQFLETNENPLIGVPMRKPGYMKSSGLRFEGASLGAGASGGKKRGRPRKVGGSVIGGPSNDPVNRGKITGGRKRGKGDSEDDPELASIFGKMKLEPAQPQPKGQRPKSAPSVAPVHNTNKRNAKASPEAQAGAPVGERRIAKAKRKTGSALFKKKGTFPLETKPGEPLTETQIVTNGKLGQGLKKGRGPKQSKIVPLDADAKTVIVKQKKFLRPTKKFELPLQRTKVALPTSAWTDESVYTHPNETDTENIYNEPEDVYQDMSNSARFVVNEPIMGTKTKPSGRGKSGGKLKTLLHSSSFSGGKKTSPWIQHCKAYASAHGVSYKQAMKDAKASYKK